MKHRPEPFPPVKHKHSPEYQESLRLLAERTIKDPSREGLEPWKDVRRIVYGNYCDAISWAEVCLAVPDCELN
jgi:hypothetical protein